MKLNNFLCGILVVLGANAQAGDLSKINLSTHNTVVIRGPINNKSITKAKMELNRLKVIRAFKKHPIYLVLDSPGGSIRAGLSFIDYVKHIPNLHTVSIMSASMAASIVEMLPGKRYVTDNGLIMFHRAAGAFRGQLEVGELETQLALWKQIVRKMEQKISDRIRIPLRDYKQKRMNEWWLTAEDAVKHNVADKIVDITCSQKLIDKRHTINMRSFFLNREIAFSGCPLFRFPLPVTKENK